MNKITIFENPEFGKIRTADIDDQIYFCGSDVAKALGYSNTRDALSKHCKGVVDLLTPSNGGNQGPREGVAKRDGVSLTTNQQVSKGGRQ